MRAGLRDFSRRDAFPRLAPSWQVDDIADRAVLNQIADMVVDLAVPITPPTTSTSAPAISAGIDAEEGQSPLEPHVDVASPVGVVTTEGTAPLASKDDPENGRAAIDRDNDNVNDSDAAISSLSGSAADDSPEDADSKPRLRVDGERPSSSVEGSEALDEADSGEERADEGGSIRCASVKKPNILKFLLRRLTCDKIISVRRLGEGRSDERLCDASGEREKLRLSCAGHRCSHSILGLRQILLPSRHTATPSPSKKPSALTGLAQKAQADWQGQVTAREVAKKARARQLRVSNEVVRVSLFHQFLVHRQ